VTDCRRLGCSTAALDRWWDVKGAPFSRILMCARILRMPDTIASCQNVTVHRRNFL
jgi:hypothetical protein